MSDPDLVGAVEYVGDGLYARFGGFDTVLWTQRIEGRHWIAVEPDMWTSILRIAARHPAAAEAIKQAAKEIGEKTD